MTWLARTLALLAALLATTPAPADQILPPGRILGSTGSGDILFGALKMGKRQSGKLILQPDSLEIQGAGSTGPIDGMSVTPRNGTRARALSEKFRDYGVSVLDHGPSVGTGGDDSAAINAAIVEAINNPAKAGNVFFPTPPSGFYNVCASPVEIPGFGANLHLRGSVGSGAKVRLMPGCTSGITSVLHQTSNTAQSSRVRIDNMVFDGRCGTQYAANIEYAVGWTATNTIFRNAKAGGATVYIGGGYEFSIGDGNRIENINEADNGNCYGTANDMPDYGLQTRSTDSYFTGLIVINAKVATVYNENGGGNNYTGTHAWGYPANAFGLGGPDMRPQYSFSVKGVAHVTAAISDNFTLAGFYFQNDAYGSKAKIIGSMCIGTNTPGAACILLADGVDSVMVLGNNVMGVSNPSVNGIVKQGALAGSSIIRNNAGAGFETPISLTNVVGGDAARLESYGAGGGVGLYPTSPNASAGLFLSDKGGASVVLQSNGAAALTVNNPTSAVNRLQITGNTAGSGPTLSATGSDTNIAATVTGKGTSGINLGAYTAQAADPTTGQIPAGRCADWHNSTAVTFKRWCNFGGTLRSITYN